MRVIIILYLSLSLNDIRRIDKYKSQQSNIRQVIIILYLVLNSVSVNPYLEYARFFTLLTPNIP